MSSLKKRNNLLYSGILSFFKKDKKNQNGDVEDAGMIPTVEDLSSKLDLLMKSSQTQQKDEHFLNELWKYVLLSKNVNRTLPVCKECGNDAEFSFEGFWGIKKVGNGVIFFPTLDGTIYSVPDMVFHILFFHDVEPTDFFRELVAYASSLNTPDYFKQIESVYFVKRMINASNAPKCPACGRNYEGPLAYRQGMQQEKVTVYRADSLLQNTTPKYMGVCDKCHQIVSI